MVFLSMLFTGRLAAEAAAKGLRPQSPPARAADFNRHVLSGLQRVKTGRSQVSIPVIDAVDYTRFSACTIGMKQPSKRTRKTCETSDISRLGENSDIAGLAPAFGGVTRRKCGRMERIF